MAEQLHEAASDKDLLSTTEAEFVAVSEATKEIIWLKRLFQEICIQIDTPVLQVDNESAIRLIKNLEFHSIDVRYKFIREKYNEGELNVKHVASKNQEADI